MQHSSQTHITAFVIDYFHLFDIKLAQAVRAALDRGVVHEIIALVLPHPIVSPSPLTSAISHADRVAALEVASRGARDGEMGQMYHKVVSVGTVRHATNEAFVAASLVGHRSASGREHQDQVIFCSPLLPYAFKQPITINGYTFKLQSL